MVVAEDQGIALNFPGFGRTGVIRGIPGVVWFRGRRYSFSSKSENLKALYQLGIYPSIFPMKPSNQIGIYNVTCKSKKIVKMN